MDSCGEVIFSQASVILFTGGCLPDTPPGQTPQVDTLPGQTPPGRHPPPPADGYCSGRYASYWNAFLFTVFFETYGCQMNVNDTEIAWTFLKDSGFTKTTDLIEVPI